MPRNRTISGANDGVVLNQCCCCPMYTADRSPAMDALAKIKNLSKGYSLLIERYTMIIMPANVPSTSDNKKTGKENPTY